MEALGSSWDALLGDMGGTWSAVMLASVFVVVASSWYLRRQKRSICWSDGEEWAAPGEWVRPFSNVEHTFSLSMMTNSMDTVQLLYLKSEQPITFDVVHQALTILSKRVLILQLSMGWRGMWPWYRRLKNFTVPLTQSSKEPLDVYREQMNIGYNNREEPWWRATLVQQPSTSPGTHEAALVWTLYHGITDGTTNMVISRDLLTIINALTTGKDADTPIRGLSPPLSDSLVPTFDYIPGLYFIWTFIYNCVPKIFSRGAANLLPSPPVSQPLTSALLHDFSQEVSGQLVRRCKESGVRMHSCMLAACGLAFIRTAQKTNKGLKTMQIIHETPVNLRRTYPACHQESLGSVSLEIVLKHQMSDNQDFWAMAKNIQDDLYTEIEKNGMPLRMSRVGWFIGVLFPINQFLVWIGLPPLTYTHFLLTNMGDLRKLLPTTYNGPVQITRLLRSFSAHFMATCFGVVTQTFGGRLLLSVDHYTTKTTDETAKSFMNNLIQIISDIAVHGAPMKVPISLRNGYDHVTSSLSNGCNGHVPVESNGLDPAISNGNNIPQKTADDDTTNHTLSISSQNHINIDKSSQSQDKNTPNVLDTDLSSTISYDSTPDSLPAKDLIPIQLRDDACFQNLVISSDSCKGHDTTLETTTKTHILTTNYTKDITLTSAEKIM